MIQLLLAFVAGLLTVAAPCILPMLPILLGAGIGRQGRQRPLLIVAGFVVSFAALGLMLSAVISSLGLSPNTLRYAAVSALSLFAVFMIWPKPFELITSFIPKIFKPAGQAGRGSGNLDALLLGMTLGIIWTPCAGPVLGSILTLIATQGPGGKAVVLLLAYAAGAGLPMLAVIYFGQLLTGKIRMLAAYSARLQQIFGVLILLLAAAMFFQYDTAAINRLAGAFPQNSWEQTLVSNFFPTPNKTDDTGSKPSLAGQIAFSDYGPAPEFSGISRWLNSEPLTMKELKGKVVLLDFWTYTCVNCVRTLPYVAKWYDNYKDRGLVVIGAHTPEFPFEKESSNVQNAISQYGIRYPVAQDNNYATWNAYNNQYWPAEYLIDQNGHIVYEHFGEGEYDRTENAIRLLLGLDNPVGADNGQDLSRIFSPEMYFGTSRLANLTPAQQPSEQAADYQPPINLPLNNFSLEGRWQFDREKALLADGTGKIRLHFYAGKVFIVAAAEKPVTLEVVVDGAEKKSVTVNASKLYPLFDTSDYREHTMEIIIPQSGLQAFTFTFG